MYGNTKWTAKLIKNIFILCISYCIILITFQQVKYDVNEQQCIIDSWTIVLW